jgi:AAA15 family ATPase/GTPase
MLLEFRLRNFRAFRDEATFSLIASADKALLDENTVQTGLLALPRVVRSAAIYGPNAGGKTTLLRALQLMRGIVVESASLKPEQAFNVQPFRLDNTSWSEPTLFEITVLIDGVRHQYGFEFTQTRILAEWLLVYQTARPQRWINRTFDRVTKKEDFDFSSYLTGPKRVWQEATRPNALFLSTAVQLNSDILQPLFRWFLGSLNVFLDGGHIQHDFSTGMVEKEKGRESIAAMLSAADIGIRSIAVERQKAMQRDIHVNFGTGDVETSENENEILMPKFRHQVGEFKADFDYTDESQGTQKLFALAGPILDIIEKGSLLVIDELDRSLHPLLVRLLVKTFQDPEINTRGAQLIFSTHDTSLLDATLLRRDQIWFVEKDRAQSATLVPLTDFSPRKEEAFERGYLSGRYGGVPILERRLLPVKSDAKR